MRRSLASGAGPPEIGARSRCLASRNAMRRLSRRSRSSVIRIIATAIRTPPTTGAARTMAYLIISPPTISRHVCGPNGLPAGGSWLLGTGRYAVPRVGRPSIAPEKLLRALLLQVLYTIRSERLLMEQLDYNLLFRWFVGLEMDDPVWNA